MYKKINVKVKWFKFFNGKSIFIILICLLTFYPNVLLAEIHRYVDPDGVSHFTDIPGSESSLEKEIYQPKPEWKSSHHKAEKPKGKFFNKELIIAAKEGHINTVKNLLSQGADVNMKDDNGFTALMHAAASGHVDTVRTLLINGANVNVEDRDGSTALMHAAGNDHTDVVKILLTKGYNVNAKRKDGFTALSLAATNGHTDTVNTLLDKGADVNAKDIDGSTALIYASMNGHNNTVKALLRKGANVNEREKNGLFSPLMAAAFNGHTDIVNTLLARGANVNEKNKNEFTPLMHAAANGHTDTVKVLLARGAYVHAGEKNGRTALEFAILKGHHRIVQLLKKNIYNETFPFAETLKTKKGNLEKKGKLQEIEESTATHLPGYSFFSFLAKICLVLSIIYFYIYLYKKTKKWEEIHQDQDSNKVEEKEKLRQEEKERLSTLDYFLSHPLKVAFAVLGLIFLVLMIMIASRPSRSSFDKFPDIYDKDLKDTLEEYGETETLTQQPRVEKFESSDRVEAETWCSEKADAEEAKLVPPYNPTEIEKIRGRAAFMRECMKNLGY